MSTRCQVRVEGGINSPGDTVTLYHHCDGYPTGMLPLIAQAVEGRGEDWKMGRAGYAASVIIAQDQDGYEPESGHRLHGDIEWYYVVKVGKPGWEVEVWRPSHDGTPEKPGKLVVAMPAAQAALEAEQIEKRGYGDDE
jgi:hypothetical protein